MAIRHKILFLAFILIGISSAFSVSAANSCPTDDGHGVGCLSPAAPYYCNGACRAATQCDGAGWTPSPICSSLFTCTNVATADACGYAATCDGTHTRCGAWPNYTCTTLTVTPTSPCNSYDSCAGYCNGCIGTHQICASTHVCVAKLACLPGQTFNPCTNVCDGTASILKLGYDSVSGTSVIQSATYPKIFIPSTGYVGINTISPNDIFSIGNSGTAAPAGSSGTGHNYTSTYLSTDDYALANYGLVKSLIGAATSSSALWGGAIGGNVWNLNSGNVGIGTNNPGANLEISRTQANNDWAALTISNRGSWSTAVNKYAQLAFTDGTGNVAGIGATYSGGIGRLDFNGLYNSGYGLTSVVAMSILGNGRVGIGTTSPAARLDVAGFFQVDSEGKKIKLDNVNSFSGSIDTASDFPGCTAPARIYTIGRVNASGTANDFMELEIIGSHRGYSHDYIERKKYVIHFGDKMTSNLVESIDQSYVGLWNGADGGGFNNVDAANQDIRLVVNPSCGAPLSYTVNVRYSSSLNFTPSASRFNYVNHSSYTASIPAPTLQLFKGNVGIGTSNPSAKLEIFAAQNTTASQFTSPFIRLNPSSATDVTGFTGISYGISTVNNYGWTVGARRTEAGAANHAFVFNSHINNAQGTELMRLTSSGSLGIGTTIPNDILSLANAGVGAPAGSSNTGHNYTSTYLSTDDYALANYGLVKTLIGAATSSSALWGGAIGGNVWSLNSGNVGIGTNNPGAKLDVTSGIISIGSSNISNGQQSSLKIYSYDNNAQQIGTLAANYADSLRTINLFGSANTSQIKIDASANASGNIILMPGTSGKVGIGTTNPGEKLTISSGNIKLYSTQNVADQYRYIGTEYDNGNGNNKAEIRFAIDGADTKTRLTFHTANGVNTINEQMRITSGGNVGIGTTNPGSNKLQVNGNIYANNSANAILVNASAGSRAIYSDNSNFYTPASHNSHSWLRNSANLWTFQGGTAGDDWTQTAQLYLNPVGTAGADDKLIELGQRQSNSTAGDYKGLRIVHYTGNAVADGYLQAGTGYFSGNVGIGAATPNDALSIGVGGVAAPAGSDRTGHNYTSTYLTNDSYALTNTGYVKSLFDSIQSSLPRYVTSTPATYNGSQSGYTGANTLCNAVVPGSHVCTGAEILTTINSGHSNDIPRGTDIAPVTLWTNNGAPGYFANVNDCQGWINAASGTYGNVWIKGASSDGYGSLGMCNLNYAYACCK